MEQLMKQLIERIEALERRCFNLAWGKKNRGKVGGVDKL